MKKFILLVALGIAAASYQPVSAQLNVSVNLNSQPKWGPKGYNYVDYYYLPDVESYYHVPSKKFIYQDNNQWIHRNSLPNKYRSYNLYQGRTVVINQPSPYLQHQTYYAKYAKKYEHDRKKVYKRYDKDYKKYNHDRNKKRKAYNKKYEKRKDRD